MNDTQSQQPYIIRLNHISKNFSGVKALDDVSFDLKQGEVHCIAGENGCGKSTLIKIISGVYTAEKGAKIEIFGQKYNHITPMLARNLGIHVIWQDLAIFPHLSVAENIAFDENLGNIVSFSSKKRLDAKAQKILDELGFELPLDKEAGKLNIAGRQIIAICRALASDVKILFMDEPTASLTHDEAKRLFELAGVLTKQGISIVFVSHRTSEMLEISHRFTIIRGGVHQGTWDASEINSTKLVALMTGKTLSHDITAQDKSSEPKLLDVKDLSRPKEYNNVSFYIRRCEIVGLSGRLGAGRTELALSLFGMTKPASGSIMLNQKDYHISNNQNAIGGGIAYVSEDRLSLGLVQEQSIERNSNITILHQIKDKFGFIYESKCLQLASDWVKKLNIKIGDLQNPVNSLSGGNQQKVVLAKWLATKPKLLILDSPTVGVDVGARAGLFKIIRDLANSGVSILLISDEVGEIYHHADRIYHMRQGHIIGEHLPQNISLSQLEEEIYG